MTVSASEDLLLAAAAGGGLVLTATKRLARRMRRHFDLRQSEAGLQVWPTPAIHSGDAWLQLAAGSLGEGWRLLGSHPARRLWERVVDAGEEGASQALLQIAATARWAEEAHALLSEYGGDPADFPLTADHVAFLRWRRLYLETCRREGWLDRATLAETVASAVADGALPAPPQLWFAGFDDLPPRFRRLAEAFAARGAEVCEIPPPEEPRGELLRLPCADVREEVRRAARWVRRLLEEGEGEGEIGIVVPDLQGYRHLIERIFREEIDPEEQVRPGVGERRFNLSLGVPLAGTGAVAAALEILAAAPDLPLARTGFLLRSPYLGGAMREEVVRARLDRHLRVAGEPVVSLARLKGGAERPRPETGRESAPVLGRIIEALLQESRDRERRLPGSWAGRFAQTLAAVGWPGERPLDSLDFQAVKAWKEKVLAPLATFDLVSGPMGRMDALALARRLAAETEFQPEGPESPVQVVGLLEAAGLRFRHLWVMGLHDGALPAPARPNPFLPVALQSAAGMPHADAEREGAFARRVAARLFAAAPFVVLSHPLREGDSALLPSPFIREVPVGEVPLAESRSPALLWNVSAPPLDELPDSAGPPLPSEERSSGGTAILRDQALCPFRAFVRHRLGGAALEEPDIGLDPRERGNLLHKTLELFWKKTADHAGLLALGEEGRVKRLAECIAEAIEALHAGREGRLPLLGLERERLLLLAGEWLELELLRPPFTVVEREGEHREVFGGVEIRTRVDRVDRLEGGGLVVLDYKTGPVDSADLVGERLTEPQLPVYGLARGGALSAVAFASLRRGKCAFAGVAREGEVLPKVKPLCDWKKAQEAGLPDWEALLERWRERLHALGAAFATGEAAVDPVSFEKACRTCDLDPLCRVGEGTSLSMEGGDE